MRTRNVAIVVAEASAIRFLCAGAIAVLLTACASKSSRLFEREAPEVNEAIEALDAGKATAAEGLLEEYLQTGKCSEGNIGAPPRVRERPQASFDLGLALFQIGESYGGRFGDEERDAGGDESKRAARSAEIACALRVLASFAGDERVASDLRAHVRYLEGNLQFLDGAYEAAVAAYDQSLKLVPGQVDAGDPFARDAAWNRAIALRRIEDKKNQDAGADASPDTGANDAGPDTGPDANPDAGAPDASPDADSPPDAGGDASSQPDGGGGGDGGSDGSADGGAQDNAGKDGGGDDGGGDAESPPPPQEQARDAGAPPPTNANQDERILDQFDNTPTVQQEAMRKQRRVVRGMADK